MKGKILVLLTLWISILAKPSWVMAVVDPREVANNKLGVHVLDPAEIEAASKMVNNDGKAAYGYITVPIQAWDRDRVKWGEFMSKAAELRVIPIIRVATYAEGDRWAEPNNYDLVDFANFLNDLKWPTKNRYIIIFNEVNRADEYGGLVSPERYADILVNAIKIFKERNEDFFVMPAGLDNAAPSNGQFIRWDEYLRRMQQRQPEIFSMIDGWVSHAYPNPGFTGRVSDVHDHSIVSYRHDLQLVAPWTNKDLPVFITETGWDISKLGEQQVAANFEAAMKQIWSDNQVVAVTPFLLHAVGGPFEKFSLLTTGSEPTKVYESLKTLAVEGKPELATEPQVAGATDSFKSEGEALSKDQSLVARVNSFWELIKKWLGLKSGLEEKTIMVGEKEYRVEIADTAEARRRGLSGREGLADNQGMLFLFEQKGYYNFWMKEMRFDIDIVWILDDKVVGVSEGKYKNEFRVLRPAEAVNKVLEVKAGSGIKPGDTIK